MIIDLCIVHGFTPAPPGLGIVSFRASQSPVTDYLAKVYAFGGNTVLATQDLGTPQPNEDGIIYSNMKDTLNALPAGNYQVTVTATGPGGSTESAISNIFTVPLQ